MQCIVSLTNLFVGVTCVCARVCVQVMLDGTAAAAPVSVRRCNLTPMNDNDQGTQETTPTPTPLSLADAAAVAAAAAADDDFPLPPSSQPQPLRKMQSEDASSSFNRTHEVSPSLYVSAPRARRRPLSLAHTHSLTCPPVPQEANEILAGISSTMASLGETFTDPDFTPAAADAAASGGMSTEGGREEGRVVCYFVVLSCHRIFFRKLL